MRSRCSSVPQRAGGAFRYAGKAPLFQEVVANQDSFDRYVAQLAAACTAKGVTIRYGVDVTRCAGTAARRSTAS